MIDVLITNEGFVAGFAFPEAGTMGGGGTFRAVLIDPGGATRIDDRTERESPSSPHGNSTPWGEGTFHHAGLQRVLFRIADRDHARRSEEWWTTELPQASPLVRFRPRASLPSTTKADIITGLREVHGTPLTLVQWRLFDWPQIGIAFALLDRDAKLVWYVDFPTELNRPDLQDDLPFLRRFVHHETLLPEQQPGHFRIGLPQQKQQVRFCVSNDRGAWKVDEVSREPWTFETGAQRSTTVGSTMEITALARRSSTRLDVKATTHSAVAIDVYGRVLLQDETTGSIHVFDSQGKPSFVCQAEPSDLTGFRSTSSLTARSGGGVALRVAFDSIVEFTADGTRLAPRAIEPGLGRLAYDPTDGTVWVERSGDIVQLGPDLTPITTWNRWPDGTWITDCDGLAISNDGVLAVTASLTRSDGTERRAILYYDPRAPSNIQACDLPSDIPPWHMAVGPTWTMISNYSDIGYLVRRDGTKLIRFDLDQANRDRSSWVLGFDQSSHDILALELISMTLHRFAVPGEGDGR